MTINQSELVPGLIKFIYRNAQENRKPLGEAVLIEKIEDGLPFILDDILPEREQKVWILQKWRVKFITKTPLGESLIHENEPIMKLRVLESTGLKASHSSNQMQSTDNELRRDSFLIVNGKEIY